MQTHSQRAFWWTAAASLACVVACVTAGIGCASWNPYNRARWAEEEKRFGPTFPTQQEQLREMAAGAGNLSESEKAAKSQELTTRLRAESNALMRAEIVGVLGAMRGPAAMPGLQFALNDPQTHVRIAACQALGRQGGPEAATLLTETLGSDTDVDVRLAATRALGSTNGSQAISGLSLALDDPNPALQFRAMQSLKNVSDQDYGNDVTKWREFASRHTPSSDSIIAEQPGGEQRR